MIVKPQLFQHEFLFRAHDAMSHQGISNVVARIQERHTWPGIGRTLVEYVSQWPYLSASTRKTWQRPFSSQEHLEWVLQRNRKLCLRRDGTNFFLVGHRTSLYYHFFGSWCRG